MTSTRRSPRGSPPRALARAAEATRPPCPPSRASATLAHGAQGLAPTVVRQLFEIIRIFRDQGIAVLLVEQFVESALEVADRAYVFEHGTIGMSGPAAELRSNRTLVAGSYLGTAADAPAKGALNGNGHHVDPALMEILSVRVPAKLKRALEQRAETEGRPTVAVVVDLLEEVDSR